MMFYLYVAYYLIMNILAFALYSVDKKRAIKRQWRIPEIVLLGLAFFGGALGAFIAMHVFRHKTRYGRFAMGVPAMILVHGCLGVFLIVKGRLSLPF